MTTRSKSNVVEAIKHGVISTEIEARLNDKVRQSPALQSLWARIATGSGSPSWMDCGYLLPTIHPRAGMGHRVSSWIAAYAYAMDHNLILLHKPWIDNWDTFLGIDTNPVWTGWRRNMIALPPIGDETDERGNALHRAIVDSSRAPDTVFRLPLDHPRHDQSIAFETLQERFLAIHGRKSPNQIFQIAIHIRRGDVKPSMIDRYRHLEYFETQMRNVIQALTSLGVPFRVSVYAQGSSPHWSGMADINFNVETDDDPFRTFSAMARSDLLITSPSSFSMTAGMVSRGIVMRPRQWFHKMPENGRWVGVEADGSCASQRLRDAIADHLQRRVDDSAPSVK